MKFVHHVGQRLQWIGGLFAACVLPVVYLPEAVQAQPSDVIAAEPSDFLCYMETNDGDVVDLTRLCGGPTTLLVSTVSRRDQQFLDRYTSLLEQRSRGNPSVQAVVAQAQSSPDSIVNRAKAICSSMRAGQPSPISLAEIGGDLLQTMAPKYFCPELDD